MFKKLQCLYLLGAAFIFFVTAPLQLAQTTSGSVVGTITDPSGAAVASAPVSLINVDTNETRNDTTNAGGLYQFVNVSPGNYRLEVHQPGFQREVRQPVVVQTASTVRIDMALTVGNVNQTIEVTAQTPLVQAETSSLGTVVDQRQTTELPLNGRNPMSLVALAPSVVPQGQSMENANGTNPFGWGNYQIGGGMANQSMVWLDGSPVNGSYINITALIPTQDSLQEFKVQSSDLPPEYGRFAGGVVNFTTKSGTNELHGSAWEFLRNKDLNANDFFDNGAGVGRPAFTQNQFGFNLGGPVYIPHIYDGRNKTFFFIDYEGFRLREGQSFTETVPTLAERGGNFNGSGTTIYDPLTTCGVTGGPVCAPGEAQYTRQAFAGNQIPTSRLNATSLQMLNLYPLPNTAGSDNGLNNNFVTNASVGGGNNETVVHLDQNVSDKQHISARYTYWGNLNLPIDPLKNGVCQDRCEEIFNTNNFVLSDTYSFSPSTILDVRASYQRFSYDRTPETLGYNLTQLGWPAALNTEAVFDDLPVACISGYDPANIFCSQGAGSVIIDRNDNYRVAGTLTKIAGNHTFQMGGEAMRMTHNYAQTNIPTGFFNFDAGFTQSVALASNAGASNGNALASFLLGYPSGTNTSDATSPALVAAEQYYGGAFLNDDWHVTSKLTLNLGIRWEHAGPWTERYNRESYFDPTGTNPLTGNAGRIDLVDSSTDPNRSNINPDWKQFAPRVGLAYAVTPKTVIHAAYGVFWLPNDVAWDYSPNNNPINSFTTTYISSVNGGITPYGNFTNPFPNGIIGPPGRNPDYQQELLGQGPNDPELGNPYGYAQQYNIQIQQQIGNTFQMSVAYAGSRGVHLPIDSPQIDELPDQYLSMGSALNNSVPNPYYGVVQSGTLSTPTVAAGQLLRPYPQYNGVNYSGEGIGNSSYNSLQVTATQRFNSGASIQLAYTHSKLISDTDTVTNWLENGGGTTYQDWNNLRGERSLSMNDVPDRLVVSYVYDLPVGKGRKFMANAPGILQQTIGGWGVEGITTLQSGFPLHFSTSQNNTDSFGGGSRPNVSAGCAETTSGSAVARLNDWFNTGCFSQPASYTFGDESRVDPTLRSQGILNFDFSAYKNFPFAKEGKDYLQFRAEFFNIFNRVQFQPPGTTLGTSQFGVVSLQANLPRLVQFALRLNF